MVSAKKSATKKSATKEPIPEWAQERLNLVRSIAKLKKERTEDGVRFARRAEMWGQEKTRIMEGINDQNKHIESLNERVNALLEDASRWERRFDIALELFDALSGHDRTYPVAPKRKATKG